MTEKVTSQMPPLKARGDALETFLRKEPSLMVLPAHEVLDPLHSRFEAFERLCRFADVDKVERVVTFRVTRSSLLRAAGEGLDLGAALEFLRVHSSTGIPETLERLFSEVTQKRGEVQVARAGGYLAFRDPFYCCPGAGRGPPKRVCGAQGG